MPVIFNNNSYAQATMACDNSLHHTLVIAIMYLLIVLPTTYKGEAYISITSESTFFQSISDIINLVNHNALLKYSIYSCLIKVLHQCSLLLCLFYSHFVLEII